MDIEISEDKYPKSYEKEQRGSVYEMNCARFFEDKRKEKENNSYNEPYTSPKKNMPEYYLIQIVKGIDGSLSGQFRSHVDGRKKPSCESCSQYREKNKAKVIFPRTHDENIILSENRISFILVSKFRGLLIYSGYVISIKNYLCEFSEIEDFPIEIEERLQFKTGCR